MRPKGNGVNYLRDRSELTLRPQIVHKCTVTTTDSEKKMGANFMAQAQPRKQDHGRHRHTGKGRGGATHSLGDDAAPAFVEGALHDGVVGARWPRPDHERVGHLQPVHAHREVRLAGGGRGGRGADVRRALPPGEPALLQRRGGRRRRGRGAKRQRFHGAVVLFFCEGFLCFDKNLWEYHG